MRLPFRREKELFSALHGIIGLYPRKIEYYKTALMHKSMHRRNEKGRPINNERLEFLGDAVLDAVVGDIVFRHFLGKREGFLTNARSKLVARDSLGRLAQEVGLDRLIMSSGNCKSHHNSFINGNAFEALVGALYLDRGYDACMRFMQKRILLQIVNIDKVAYKEVNFKSKLLEWCQKNRVKMEFKSVSHTTTAEANSPVFECQTMIEGIEGAMGKGYTKKESQQQASKNTLHRLRREPKFLDAVFAAKGNRTKMEEEPVSVAPDPEEESKSDFIMTKPRLSAASSQSSQMVGARQNLNVVEMEGGSGDEFDLSNISVKPKVKSREDIIAEAEAAAFNG